MNVSDTVKPIDLIEPESVRNHFIQICNRKHNSGEEDEIREYVAEVARRHPDNLELSFHKKDAKKPGERVIVIRNKLATEKGNKPVVILQAHMDMVCVPNSNIFPINPIECGKDGEKEGKGWLKAGGYTPKDGTTLGADDGIGVATALALMEDEELNKSVPMEFFFTVEEETVMGGAKGFAPEILVGRKYINLDSERAKSIIYGGAGGDRTDYEWPWKSSRIPEGMKCVKLEISGLAGGHSGVYIHENRGNAIKFLTEILSVAVKEKIELNLVYLSGGKLGNAIPSESSAVVAIKEEDLHRFFKTIEIEARTLKGKFEKTDPNFKFAWCMVCFGEKEYLLDPEMTRRMLAFLSLIPHGVREWYDQKTVKTSTNLAIVDTISEKFTVCCTHRSLEAKSMDTLMEGHRSIGELYKVKTKQDSNANRFPEWQPNEKSELLDTAKKVYEEQYGKAGFKAEIIHAGLECGLVIEKYKSSGLPMDCISIGPTIEDAHSYKERLEGKSVKEFYDCLLKILKAIKA